MLKSNILLPNNYSVHKTSEDLDYITDANLIMTNA
jgi:hypothetical protein